MDLKEKQLLLADLCARLPYEINVDIKYQKENGSSLRLAVCSEGMLPLNTDLLGLFQEEEIYLKPYLRPMSSMTEEEKEEFDEITLIHTPWGIQMDRIPKLINWLNKKVFDYRKDDEGKTMIEKGLALEAPEGMYV